MAPAPTPLHQPQLALDEQTVEIPELEQALDSRLARQEGLGHARALFKEADTAARAEIAKLELPEGHAVRAGKYRITRSAIPARSVSFDTEPTTRVRISVVEE